MEYFTELGHIGLFIAAFLAATILPLSSEVVLSGLLLSGLAPTPLILIATVGNVLGSLLNYALGYWATHNNIKKWLGLSEDNVLNAEKRFKKFGLTALLFAWVPVIGDPLTVVAGVLRIQLRWFILAVTAGKLARYMVICHLTLQVV